MESEFFMLLQAREPNTETAATNIFNKELAFKKLAQSTEFLAWHKIEVAKRLGYIKNVEEIVDAEMGKIRIEYL